MIKQGHTLVPARSTAVITCLLRAQPSEALSMLLCSPAVWTLLGPHATSGEQIRHQTPTMSFGINGYLSLPCREFRFSWGKDNHLLQSLRDDWNTQDISLGFAEPTSSLQLGKPLLTISKPCTFTQLPN